MDEKRVIGSVARSGGGRKLGLLVAISLGVCCSLPVTPTYSQSIGDRFKSLFGGTPDQSPSPVINPKEPETDLTCPSVSIRAGASTFSVGTPGKQAVGPDLRYQATITKMARECNLSGGQITARVGIQGRVIAGPAGAPSSVDIPLRVAVVQTGVQEKIIATKAYQTTVVMSQDSSVPFTLVGEDLVYPAPSAAAGDSYVFYVGFDPQAIKAAPEPRKARKK